MQYFNLCRILVSYVRSYCKEYRMTRVLVVDDDNNVRRFFRCLLERAHYEVTEADDGDVALRVLKKSLPDVVITDVLMPNREGLELIQDIKSHYPHIKVIALSGGGVLDIRYCLAFADGFGADRVFAKPVKPQQLLGSLKELLTAAQVA